MDLVDAPWTVERFIEWYNRQEQKHEFDGVRPVPMPGGSCTHQSLWLNITILLRSLTDRLRFKVLPEMRLKVGRVARYPDVSVVAAPISGTTRTLTDALVLFEVLSDDTAHTDRVDKLNEYGTLPGIRHYVLIEQDRVGALVHAREGDRWIAQAVTEGVVALPGIGVELALSDIYADITF